MAVDEKQQRELIQQAVRERWAAAQPTFQVVLDAAACLQVIGVLQLALRHPGNNGPSADTARAVIAGLIEQMKAAGYEAHARIAELGNDPGNDV